MGNIILTQEDADSILAFLREELPAIKETKTKIVEDGKDLKANLDKVIKDAGVPEELNEIIDFKAFCNMVITSQEEKTMKALEERKNKVVRFIELLTIGSET